MKVLGHHSHPPTLGNRAAGVLLHPTSLASAYGIGDLGPAAFEFVDFMVAAGLRWWQMLPIGPTGLENSPYQSYSTFAGHALLISPDLLHKQGFLSSQDLLKARIKPSAKINFRHVAALKRLLLRKAFVAFQSSAFSLSHQAFALYRRKQAWWLDDFVVFSALRCKYGEDWTRWNKALRQRHPKAIQKEKRELKNEMSYFAFQEWIFTSQWAALRAYAAERGIGFIGDVPIFVAPESCDVWSHPGIFQLRHDGRPRVVSGVGPDYFSKTGQRWGNPHYNWPALKRQGYDWWIKRFRQNFRYFDVVRLDHFLGFIRYYEIPGMAETAEFGRYEKGPGAHFFQKVLKALPMARDGSSVFIAEDLGVITPNVKELRDKFGFPGMKVLQFAFGLDPEAQYYQPHAYPRHAVVYTGTHDNDTTLGWFNDKASTASTRSKEDIAKETAFTLRYLNASAKDIHWAMIRAAFGSVANTAIVPMQDFLGLGSQARMNRPGVAHGNWGWRMIKAPPVELAAKIRSLIETYARIN